MLDSRIAMLWIATGVTPAMCMRLTGVGSQYLLASFDSAGEPFDGAQTYRLTLPPDIPAGRFWLLTLYDNQTPLDVADPAALPAGRQPELPDAGRHRTPGRVDHDHDRPRATRRGRRWQLDPDRARQGLVHPAAAVQPATAVLDQSWRPSEIDRAG